MAVEYYFDDGNALTLGDGTASTQFYIDGAAATVRDIIFRSAGVTRWIVRANADAESGSDVGSDFELSRRDDAGAELDKPIQIARDTGQLNFLSGSAAAPAIIFNSDVDAGLYSPGADTIGVSAGGTKVLEINDDGPNGQLVINSSSGELTNPSIAWEGDQNTGINWGGGGATLMVNDGVRSFWFDDTFVAAEVPLWIGFNSASHDNNHIYMRTISSADLTNPTGNDAKIYTRNTGGKRELVVRFATGAAQQIAIEP